MSLSSAELPWPRPPSAWAIGCEEMGVWKYWLSTLSPERLGQEKERRRKYMRDNMDKIKEKEWYKRRQEKTVCVMFVVRNAEEIKCVDM